jgi:putative hemolysin
MRWVVLAAAMGALMAGCSVQPTVQPQADDTYAVSGHYAATTTGLLVAQNAALDEAESFCHEKGLRFHQLQDQVRPGDATYTVRFRCLAAGDPRLLRPTVNQAPDQVF